MSFTQAAGAMAVGIQVLFIIVSANLFDLSSKTGSHRRFISLNSKTPCCSNSWVFLFCVSDHFKLPLEYFSSGWEEVRWQTH